MVSIYFLCFSICKHKLFVVYCRPQRKQTWSWTVFNKRTLDKVCKLSLTLHPVLWFLHHSVPQYLQLSNNELGQTAILVPFCKDSVTSKDSASSGVSEKVGMGFFTPPTFLPCYYITFFLFLYFIDFFSSTTFPIIWTFIIINPMNKSEWINR